MERRGGPISDVTPDGTLGGYIAKHGRPPAFEASDGAFYSVDLYIADKADDDELTKDFGGALLFVRWSDDGSQPVGHLETEYLFQFDDRMELRSHMHELTLHEVKEHLERAVEAHKLLPDW